MTLPWFEWVGLLGVALVLGAFFLLQAHRLHGNGLTYQAMNAFGASGIALSLVFGTFNLSAFLMELGWIGISVYGMLVGARARAPRA